MANRVARALAQPYGAIQTDRARDAEGAAPEALGSYAAVLLFYAYWRTFDRAMIEAVRLGLERAVAAEPDYAEALACLSLVYSNAYRFRHPIGAPEPDPRGGRSSLASRAVDLAPSSSWARYALGLARWFAGDVAGAIDALEAGRALNPNDTTILADLGQRYAMLRAGTRRCRCSRSPTRATVATGQLPDRPLSRSLRPRSRRRGPERGPPGRHAGGVYGHVAVAAAAAEIGLRPRRRRRSRRSALDPDYGAHVVADLESRHVAPELVSLIVAGLAKAGLAVLALAPAATDGR